MGNVTGVLGKTLIKKARRFNVESRTDKFLDKNVKVVAPKPLATQKEIEKLNEENPNLMSELSKPNPEHIDRLKDVYVSSFDKVPVDLKAKENPNRPLPVSRKYEPEDYGYVEPESIPPGRLSLRQAVRLISQFQADKKTNNPEQLALEFNLKTEDVANIIENFRLYTVYEANNKQSRFDVPAMTSLRSDSSVATYERYKAEMEYLDSQAKQTKSQKDQQNSSSENKK